MLIIKSGGVSLYLLYPSSIVGLDTVKSTPHEAHENTAWNVVVLKY